MYRTVAPVSRSLDISPSANEAVRNKIQDALIALDNIHWCWLWPEHAEVCIADVTYQMFCGILLTVRNGIGPHQIFAPFMRRLRKCSEIWDGFPDREFTVYQ